MITLAITPHRFAVCVDGIVIENNFTALAFALDALRAGAPLEIGGTINGSDHLTFRKQPITDDSDIDAANELYADVEGEDIETSYDLLDGTEPFDV